ncbi:MAG: endo-1,4-beta-xylanase [Burkholderiales bacterium]|nr:endo-1,4-beta-xylanase [Opitutaceae bacterium]
MPAVSSALRALALPLWVAAAPTAHAQTLPEGPRLRDLADRRGFLVGTALGDNFTSSGMGASTYAAYTAVAGREFNFFTAENAHKFGRIHPDLTTYLWSTGDRYDTFARSVGAAFHGHAFAWYKTTSTPPFVVATTGRDELLGLMRDHIEAVGTRYGPGTILWDVVNESLQSSVATAPTTDWRTALRPADTDHWRAVIGTDYIEQAFRFAAATRAATDQSYQLIYNDFSNESLTNKSLAQYMMAQDFLARGVPLEGIGFQMHVGTGTPAYTSIRANFKRLSDLGLDLYITEFDTITGSSAAELDRQAAIYQRTLDVALRNPHFRAFQTWGFTDRSSWLYTWEGNPIGADVRPLPFTTDFSPKPAYYAIQDALAYEQRPPPWSTATSSPPRPPPGSPTPIPPPLWPAPRHAPSPAPPPSPCAAAPRPTAASPRISSPRSNPPPAAPAATTSPAGFACPLARRPFACVSAFPIHPAPSATSPWRASPARPGIASRAGSTSPGTAPSSPPRSTPRPRARPPTSISTPLPWATATCSPTPRWRARSPAGPPWAAAPSPPKPPRPAATTATAACAPPIAAPSGRAPPRTCAPPFSPPARACMRSADT